MAVTIDGSASVTTNDGVVLGITRGTAIASTSGTSIDFTSIPSWVKRITINFSGVSTNGTSFLAVQLGAGSITSSGYSSAGWTTNTNNTNSTTSFVLMASTAASYVWGGNATICLLGSNLWTFSSILGYQAANGMALGAGTVTLGGTLDRVRITNINGTDTFDAGTINILYEG